MWQESRRDCLPGCARPRARAESDGDWYSLSTLEKKYPHTRWVRGRRYVEDGPVITTTGVTASLPASLALVERVAGRERAAALAREVGAPGWDSAHDSDRFHLDARNVATAATNLLEFWRYERVGIPVASGVDEMSLSFTADALGRTYRTTAVTLGGGAAPIVTKRGLAIIPDDAEPGGAGRIDRLARVPGDDVPPARSLDQALDSISRVHGESTARLVALQLEYPWKESD